VPVSGHLGGLHFGVVRINAAGNILHVYVLG
jgi:hypothetical protein